MAFVEQGREQGVLRHLPGHCCIIFPYLELHWGWLGSFWLPEGPLPSHPTLPFWRQECPLLAGTLGKGKVWAPGGPELLSLVFQPSPASKFIQGYLGAVISAVSIAVSKPPNPPTPASQARPCLRVRPRQGVWETGFCGRAIRTGFRGREE